MMTGVPVRRFGRPGEGFCLTFFGQIFSKHGVIDRLLTLLPDLSSGQFWLWTALVVAVLGGLAVGGWLLWRLRQVRAEDLEEVSWEDFVASMHDRLDQCELLLKQFAQRADKQHKELQQSVTHLQSSVEALEKPFGAVASRLSQIGGSPRRD
jgi:hypothetical protein